MNGQEAHGEMLNIAHREGNANQNHFTPIRMATVKKTSVGADVEKLKPLCTASGDVEGCRYYGKW